MEEKRQFSRVNFVTHIETDFNNKIHTGQLLDVSLKGALIETDAAGSFELGNDGILNIYLPDTGLALIFGGQVAHIHGGKIGIKFISEDIDSMTHLRRLLELNLATEQEITREFDLLIEYCELPK
ncbi:PilZ domain-containing protein [bacterium]|nr:PilZ domain-containing protein [bacterium]